MKYLSPELEYIRFEDVDILTESVDTPIATQSVDDSLPETVDGPGGDF